MSFAALMAAVRPKLATPAAARVQRSTAAPATEIVSKPPAASAWDFASIALLPPRRTPKSLGPEIAIGEVDDPLEREADRVADQVMASAGGEAVASFAQTAAPAALNRKCQACEEEEPADLQRTPTGANAPAGVAPPIVHDVLRAAGRPLDPATRAFMEPRFGADFGDVRIHTDRTAAESARAVQAKAFTVGSDVVFASEAFAPATPEGRRLIAHELAHVVQQAPRVAGRAPATARVSRMPRDDLGDQDIHSELIEAFRAANGYPPHGINPITHDPEGPTDSEIRFGGLLAAWLASQAPKQVRTVPAPAKPPKIKPMGSVLVYKQCTGRADAGPCASHLNYVINILPQAIDNIRATASPYSAAIADLYGANLSAAQAAPPPIPFGAPGKPFGNSSDVKATNVTVTFGATKFTFSEFGLMLEQDDGKGVNGQAFSAGGPIASVMMNETSADALLGKTDAVETTMVHETIHIFSAIAEAQNAARPKGAPMVEANIDRTSYAAIKTKLEAALLPYIAAIGKLPGVTPQSSAAHDASFTANIFMNEAIARTEAGIYGNQRANKSFGAVDLRSLPAFFHAPDYWTPSPPSSFIKTNQKQIDADVLPLILEFEERYLNLRP